MEQHSLNVDQEDGWDEIVIKCFDSEDKTFNRFGDIYKNPKEFTRLIETIVHYARVNQPFKGLIDEIDVITQDGRVAFQDKTGTFFSVWLERNHGN